jgi:hypothetical protein
MADLDLLLVNPGGRELIYQDLGAELTAIEPPLWCRLIAGYVLDRLRRALLDGEIPGSLRTGSPDMTSPFSIVST